MGFPRQYSVFQENRSWELSRQNLNSNDFLAMLAHVARRVNEQKERLSSLDAAIGDGDHGFNLAQGFGAVLEKLPLWKDLDPGAILKNTGRELMRAMGGAGGAVFGALFSGQGVHYSKSLSGRNELSAVHIAEMLRSAVQRIQSLGSAESGDKTMIDALVPAVDAMSDTADKGLATAMREASGAAEEGAENTRIMTGIRGRAKNLGDRSKGHVDPGAVSTAVIFSAMAEFVESD